VDAVVGPLKKENKRKTMSNIYFDKLPPNPTVHDLLAVMRPMIEPVLEKYLDRKPKIAEFIEDAGVGAPRQAYRAGVVKSLIEKEINRIIEESHAAKTRPTEADQLLWKERDLIEDFLQVCRIVELLEGKQIAQIGPLWPETCRL
jgi:hypothetical protein